MILTFYVAPGASSPSHYQDDRYQVALNIWVQKDTVASYHHLVLVNHSFYVLASEILTIPDCFCSTNRWFPILLLSVFITTLLR